MEVESEEEALEQLLLYPEEAVTAEEDMEAATEAIEVEVIEAVDWDYHSSSLYSALVVEVYLVF